MTVMLVLDPNERPTNNVSLPCKILFASSQDRISFVHKYQRWCLINHDSCKFAIPGDTSNLPREYDSCKLGQTNYLLVLKKVSGF